jgi:HAD superfamily hydrolase (TIGR01509 family)
MVKAIAFDLGGVLFAEGKSVLVKKLSEDYQYDPGIVLKILKSPKSIDLRNGLLSDEGFWSWAQGQLPDGYDAQLIKKEWYDSYLIDEDIKALLGKLQGKYKLLVFSGNIESRVEYLDQKYGFRKLFDIEVYSYDYHLCKPEREFVEAMIKASGVKPEEVVYIDDEEKAAAAAAPLGVNVIIYSRGNITQLLDDLKKHQVSV